MKFWKVRQVGDEWHVIETRFVGEPEYTLARCTGPVPAGEIEMAMFLAQSMENNGSRIHNAIGAMQEAHKRFMFEWAAAQTSKETKKDG